MHPAFEPLATRVSALGNPTRKYLRSIERHGALLVARLESAGSLSHIHLDRTAPSAAEDFRRVAAAGQDTEQTLRLLGTFYAVQLLHQNARALEQLAVDLAERGQRSEAYAAFLERAGEEFSSLISTYAGYVLRLVLPAGNAPFVLLNVGTPLHQDDIDAAVIMAEPQGRREIDRAMARLNGELLRYASPVDNYVARQLDAEGFAVTIDEVRDRLRSGGLGFVVVTELLRAERLAGEGALLDRLRDEVMAEYSYRQGEDNARHEIYLRGLLGETRALVLRPPPPDRLDPKDDGLRLALGLVTAFRTIEGVPATHPAHILARVMERRPGLREPLSQLEQSRVFLETFRQTAQLLIAQEEEIAVDGASARENLGLLAGALGYCDRGPVRAVDHLLVHYNEATEAARDAALRLMPQVARHLTEISRFARFTRGPCPEGFASELGEALAEAARSFHGVRFYDDLIEAFSTPEGLRREAFLRSYQGLSRSARHQLAQLYAEWGHDAPYTLLSLLTLFGRHAARRGLPDAFDEIATAFLERIRDSPEAVRSLSRVFRFYPQLVNRFLLALDPAALARLEIALGVPIGSPEVAAARDALQALVRVHRESSRYIKRVLGRVTERHPATVQAISDDARLRTLALGRLAASERHPSPVTQKELLGDFYDIEFLRIAMGTLWGGAEPRTQRAFADLTNRYLGRLFDFCFREVEQETGGWTLERDRLGLFLSGGNARGRPYDEDFDLIALLDSTDSGARLFAERVVVLMNAQIARRGVITEYRLARWSGRFVTTLDELVALLETGIDELFVDRCQLLGCQMVVGSRRLAECLERRVLQPLVFAHAGAFAARVLREIREHRRALSSSTPEALQLKESPGGLREIDLALVVAKARIGIWETGPDAFGELAARDPARADAYAVLRATNELLVAVRSAQRVAGAATDEVSREDLARLAPLLGYERQHGADAADRLLADVMLRLKESATLVEDVIAPGPQSGLPMSCA